MRLYCVSGLGADERVFQFLKLNVEIVPIHWIGIKVDESIQSYTKRLTPQIDQTEPFGILGVSFGGLIAVELSKILSPICTIVISSVINKNEIPFFYKLIGRMKMVNILPTFMFKAPMFIMNYVFGAKNKILLKSILDDTNYKFTKWALNEVFNWQNVNEVQNLLKINGENDKLFKPSIDSKVIEKGSHFMIVDQADKVSFEVNQFLTQFIEHT